MLTNSPFLWKTTHTATSRLIIFTFCFPKFSDHSGSVFHLFLVSFWRSALNFLVFYGGVLALCVAKRRLLSSLLHSKSFRKNLSVLVWWISYTYKTEERELMYKIRVQLTVLSMLSLGVACFIMSYNLVLSSQMKTFILTEIIIHSTILWFNMNMYVISKSLLYREWQGFLVTLYCTVKIKFIILYLRIKYPAVL